MMFILLFMGITRLCCNRLKVQCRFHYMFVIFCAFFRNAILIYLFYLDCVPKCCYSHNVSCDLNENHGACREMRT
jgi:hypothetical protein